MTLLILLWLIREINLSEIFKLSFYSLNDGIKSIEMIFEEGVTTELLSGIKLNRFIYTII